MFDLNTRITDYISIRTERERVESLLKKLEAQEELMKNDLIAAMVQENMKTLVTLDGDRVTLSTPILRAFVNAENKEEQRQWIITNGYERKCMIVHFSAFCSVVKQRIEDNESLPDWVKVQYEPVLRLTRRKENE